MVRRGRLAAGHLHLSGIAALAARCHGGSGQRDLHRHFRPDPVRCGAGLPGGEDIEQYLFHARRVLRVLGRYFSKRLQKIGVAVPEPDGAFYLFANFNAFRSELLNRGIRDSHTLCERLLEDTGVAILPGNVFGRPEEELSARLAYVDFDGSKALAASEKIPAGRQLDIDFLKENCPKMVEAAERICDWMG